MKDLKKTKIIATYGPAIANSSKVRQLADAGVNVFRVNCSHGNSSDFKKAVYIIRKGISYATFPVGLLFDISGPKLRVDRFEGEYPVKHGDTLIITSGESDLSKGIIGVNHPAIIKSVKPKERVFIDDGNIILKVKSCSKKFVTLEVQNDGVILSGKGINLPDSDVKVPTITEKDIKDIKTAVECKADFIALSFVRSGDDIIEAQKLLKKYGGDQQIIAKLEKKEAIEDIENIMLLADGVMVARGDLGVELPFEELPQLQKSIITLANYHHKPVIVATQMLESMRFSPRATRAEINDVATAVFDYVDAVMLSAETATGKYPLETVQTMARVALKTEKYSKRTPVDAQIDQHLIRSAVTHAIAKSVSSLRSEFEAKAIFAFTSTGFTAELISNLFPPQRVIALTYSKRVLTKLTLLRSVYPVLVKKPTTFRKMISTIEKVGLDSKFVDTKDKVVIAGGLPFDSSSETNFMMIHEIAK